MHGTVFDSARQEQQRPVGLIIMKMNRVTLTLRGSQVEKKKKEKKILKVSSFFYSDNKCTELTSTRATSLATRSFDAVSVS